MANAQEDDQLFVDRGVEVPSDEVGWIWAEDFPVIE
jgi:hypothetical protein